VYSRFSTSDAGTEVLQVTGDLAVVTLRRPGDASPASAAVPVRNVRGRWRVDPILDAGSYSFAPADGARVEPRPTVTVTLDDPGARARVWFDGNEATAATPTSFRSPGPLSPGWHVATVVILRGDDVVARTLAVRVASP
jgi:hypothetical protein